MNQIKMSVIEEVNKLTNMYDDHYVIFDNLIMSKPNFITNIIGDYIADYITTEQLKEVIKNHVTFYSYEQVMPMYIKSVVNHVDSLTEEEKTDLIDRITNGFRLKCVKSNAHDFKVLFADQDISINEYVGKYIRSKEAEKEALASINSLESKIEECRQSYEFALSEFEKKLVNQPSGENATLNEIVLDSTKLSLYESIMVDLPYKIKDVVLGEEIKETEVIIDGKIMPLDTVVLNYVLEANRIREDKIAKEITALEEYNKVYDKVGNVGEIQVNGSGENLEITSSIPIISTTLSEEEIANVNQSVILTTDIDNVLNKVKDSILVVNDNAALELLIGNFNDLKDKTTNTALVESIAALIDEKAKNIIKISGNKEDYADIIAGEIASGKLDDYETAKIKSEMVTKGINDFQVKDSLEKRDYDDLESYLVSAANPFDNKGELAKSQIEAQIAEIEELKSNIDISNPAQSAGFQINLDVKINELYELIKNAPISDYDKTKYLDRINNQISIINGRV